MPEAEAARTQPCLQTVLPGSRAKKATNWRRLPQCVSSSPGPARQRIWFVVMVPSKHKTGLTGQSSAQNTKRHEDKEVDKFVTATE